MPGSPAQFHMDKATSRTGHVMVDNGRQISVFQRGDRVVHPRRPEWGAGTVRQTQRIVHQGASAQRLTIDFSTRGRVVLNTAVAPLTRDDARPTAPATRTEKEPQMTRTRSNSTRTATPGTPGSDVGSGWLEQLEQATRNRSHELWELPDAMSDPFASAARRLEATLETFRFSTDARSLIDWAVLQTGLDDPLSKYTRQELEQAFPRFARDRDQHLQSLVRQLKRSGQAQLLNDSLKTARHPAARSALAKAIRN
ncbi:MAG: DUF3553 domain-containing protein [Phycisphaeraceae bacterium]